MIKNYLKVAFRFFVKDRIFTGINLLGFTLSISFALLISLWILHDFSFEKSFDDSDRIFRIVEVSKQNDIIVKKANTYMPLAKELMDNFPIFENTAFIKYESKKTLSNNEKNLECKSGYISESFFDILNFKFIEGSQENIYLKTNGIILTDKIAKKLFGNEKALNKTLVDKSYKTTTVYEVVGVIELPENTHLSFEVLFNINLLKGFFNGNGFGWKKAENFCTYVKVKENALVSVEHKKKMASFLSNYKETNSKLWFQPILDIHLYQDFDFRYDSGLGSIKLVMLNIVLAILLLSISIFNFINLNLSRSTNRYKEIAIRKINGATKRNIAIQFFCESVLQSVLAIYIALIFAELLRPIFNNTINETLTINYSLETFFYLLIAGLGLGLIAGSYPAIFISRLSPIAIFSQKTPKSFNSRLVKSLTIFQFTITTTILIIGFFVNSQLGYIQNKDLGIERENIISFKTGLWYGTEAFLQELQKNQDIISAASVMNSPVDFFWETNNVNWVGKNTTEQVNMNLVFVDANFFETYKIELLEGNFYTSDFKEYWKGGATSPVVINETAKKLINNTNIIGTIINDYYEVVGVVKDFHFKSLRESISPLIMNYYPESMEVVNVRIKPDDKVRTIAFIKDTYLKHRPERVFEYQFFDDLIDQNYQNEKRLGTVISWFLILSLIIALSGIIGLVVFTMIKRTKEVAIRKVNGARFTDIFLLFGKEYIINLGISFAVSSLIAIYVINKWINNFAYHININLFTFLIPFVIILMLTLLTLFALLCYSNRKNPVDSLRYE